MATSATPRATTTTIAGWLQVGLSVGWGVFGITLVLMGMALAGAFGQTTAEIQRAVDGGGAAGFMLLPLFLGFGTFGWIVGFAAALIVVLGVFLTGWAIFMLVLGVGVLRRSRIAGTLAAVFSVLYTLFAFGAVFGESQDFDDWPETAGVETFQESFAIDDPFRGQVVTISEPDFTQEAIRGQSPGRAQGGKGLAVLWLLAQVGLVGTLLHPATRNDFRIATDSEPEG